MPQVRMPDGTIVAFPDDMPAEQIKQMIESKFPDAVPRSEAYNQLASELSGITQSMDATLESNPIVDRKRAEYAALPAWQKPIVAATDILQTYADGVTFGFGDKAVAAARAPFTGKTYEQELAAARSGTQSARSRAGGAGTAAEITGAVSLPLKLTGRGATLAGRFGTAGMTGMKGLGARTGLMALEGAGYGALSAAGHDHDIGTGALIGAGAGAAGNLAGEAISAGVSKVAGRFNPKPPAVGVDDLKEAGQAVYKKAASQGVVFNQSGVNKLRSNIIMDLTERGFDPVNEPGVMPVIKRLQAMGKGNVTFEGLDTLRKVASNGYRPGMKSNNAAISQIIKRIDELVEAADPSTILMGKNPKAAAETIKEARRFWSRAKKLETVEKAITRGEQNAAAQVSGDVGRTTMNQLKQVLQSEAKSRGFTPEELRMLSSAAGYSPGQRIAHAVGGLMPRGRLLSSIHGALALGTGGASLPLQAAGAAVGYGAQKTAEHLSKKSVAELTRLISTGGVPAPVVKNTIQLLSEAKRDALSRALMALTIHQANVRNNKPGHQAQP